MYNGAGRVTRDVSRGISHVNYNVTGTPFVVGHDDCRLRRLRLNLFGREAERDDLQRERGHQARLRGAMRVCGREVSAHQRAAGVH